MNEVAATLVESCSKESIVMQEMGLSCWVRFRGNLVKFSEIPPYLSLHQKLDLLCYACYIRNNKSYYKLPRAGVAS